MSKSNVWEDGLLLLLFNNDSFAGVGDAGGLLQSVADGSLYMSLHSADPGEAGDQGTSEVIYTSYARVAVPRTTAGWTVTLGAGAVENAAEVPFPTATGGSAVATHFGIGTAASGAGKLLYSGSLTAPLAISNLIEPKFPAGDIDVTED